MERRSRSLKLPKQSKCAPIALFAFKRPGSLEAVLEALSQNTQFEHTQIYAFCDGPKAGAASDIVQSVRATKHVLQCWQTRANIEIFANDENCGLHRQIPHGISYVLERHDRVIVIEDDILVSPFFLDYMNDALNLYAEDFEVMQVSGFMFNVKSKLPETFFYNVNSCWGWGTWKRAWRYYNDDASALLKQLTKSPDFSMYEFNGGQNGCFYDQLVKNHLGDLKSWAVKWHASMYLHGGNCLHPNKTLVKNIGFGSDGTNCVAEDTRYNVEFAQRRIAVDRVPIVKCAEAYAAVARIFSDQETTRRKIARGLRRVADLVLRRQRIDPVYGKYLAYEDSESLRKRPRYFSGQTAFLGHAFRYSDAITLLAGMREIFHDDKYRFVANGPCPVILDCGSNIGLSVIYFKHLWPEAIIHAFEPDPDLFNILQFNVESFACRDVTLNNAALWVENAEVDFYSEGGFSGRISVDGQGERERVRCVRLRDLLETKVDFLKLDIEGAEVEVIADCSDRLHNVKHIFIEYHSQVGRKQQLDVILKALTDAGFRYQIKDVYSAKAPYLKIGQLATMDLQLEIFASKKST